MKLRMWLALKKMTVIDFSKKVGANPSYMSRIMYDHLKPGKFLAKLIENETGGAVDFDDDTPCCNKCGRPLPLECEEPQQIAV